MGIMYTYYVCTCIMYVRVLCMYMYYACIRIMYVDVLRYAFFLYRETREERNPCIIEQKYQLKHRGTHERVPEHAPELQTVEEIGQNTQAQRRRQNAVAHVSNPSTM